MTENDTNGAAKQRDLVADVTEIVSELQTPPGAALVKRVIGVIGLVSGIALLAAASLWLHRLHVDELIFRRASTQGVVVENKYQYSNAAKAQSRVRGYVSIVKFRTQEGREFTARSWILTNPPRFATGEQVTVYYDPRTPEHATIDMGAPGYLLIFVPLIMGCLLVLGGIQWLIKALS